MRWDDIKARLLSLGAARLEGETVEGLVSSSAAGPGAGGGGSVFFSMDGKRVRLAVDPRGKIRIRHLGGGIARLETDDLVLEGRLEPVALHCPRQAYITVSSGCIFCCRYCEVPGNVPQRKSIEEIVAMVEAVRDRIDAISLTSGVMESIEEEEEYMLRVLERLARFGIPIGVSIYPTPETPRRLRDLGVAEVKFNVETATADLFERVCPGLSWHDVWDALSRSVPLFGRNHVFSNLIIGLGETDEEAGACIRKLAGMGVIPVARPLNPAAGCSGYDRPSPERLLRIHAVNTAALQENGLDPTEARTMCVACTGCDLVPGRDS